MPACRRLPRCLLYNTSCIREGTYCLWQLRERVRLRVASVGRLRSMHVIHSTARGRKTSSKAKQSRARTDRRSWPLETTRPAARDEPRARRRTEWLRLRVALAGLRLLRHESKSHELSGRRQVDRSQVATRQPVPNPIFCVLDSAAVPCSVLYFPFHGLDTTMRRGVRSRRSVGNDAH